MRENVKRRIDDFADELRTADMRLNGSTIRDVSVEYPTAQAGADIITMTEEECDAAYPLGDDEEDRKCDEAMLDWESKNRDRVWREDSPYYRGPNSSQTNGFIEEADRWENRPNKEYNNPHLSPDNSSSNNNNKRQKHSHPQRSYSSHEAKQD